MREEVMVEEGILEGPGSRTAPSTPTTASWHSPPGWQSRWSCSCSPATNRWELVGASTAASACADEAGCARQAPRAGCRGRAIERPGRA
eukprot:4159446-Lingulodinium_polyedra.AAC.1